MLKLFGFDLHVEINTIIIICPYRVQQAAEHCTATPGGENGTFNYFYKLIFEAYKRINFGFSFNDLVPRRMS